MRSVLPNQTAWSTGARTAVLIGTVTAALVAARVAYSFMGGGPSYHSPLPWRAIIIYFVLTGAIIAVDQLRGQSSSMRGVAAIAGVAWITMAVTGVDFGDEHSVFAEFAVAAIVAAVPAGGVFVVTLAAFRQGFGATGRAVLGLSAAVLLGVLAMFATIFLGCAVLGACP